jgi:putative salt-induced outer membrane protein YdiY
MKRPNLRRALLTTTATLFLFVALFAGPPSADAQALEEYDDKIYLKNGDRITGNIKELDRGKLRVKTITMDTIYLNWVDVESIESNTYLRIARTDGTFTYGRVQKSDMTENLRIFDSGQTTQVPAAEIASMKPIRVDESFWHRIEGDVSAGIDFKSASDILLVNVASNLRLREEKYELSFGLNWNETSRTEDNDSSRADLSGDYTRLLEDRWFWKASAGLERNQELGIDLRTIISGTAGKYFIQTSTMRFEVNVGLAASLEDRTDGTKQDGVEGLIRSSFDIFRLNIPMTRLTANINLFPGITESGRIRINTDITLRNEIVRDFFWDLSFYSSYDNQPAEGFVSEDYGIITSLGATF